jgi:hypothetical protein
VADAEAVAVDFPLSHIDARPTYARLPTRVTPFKSVETAWASSGTFALP